MTATPSEYYDAIARVLVTNGFEWIVAQVQSQIDIGKPVFKSVSAPAVDADARTFALPATDAKLRARRRKTRLVTSHPYSDAERLDLLLNATQSAIGIRYSLSVEISKMLPQFDVVEFAPDKSLFESGQPTEERRGHRVVHSDQRDREELAGRIKGAFLQVRGDIDASS